MILRAVDIYKSFFSGSKTIEVLSGVSLSIEKGEMVALMGVSGSGKSTLMHILGLINKPDRGDIYIRKERIDFSDKEELARKRNFTIGFVFQFYSLIGELNVIENVMVPGMIKDSQADILKAKRLLDLVGFSSSMYDKMIYKLSGGEMQRVALARALMNDPDIIIADEPTANLDKTSSIDIVTSMRDINSSKKTTFIIATHNEEVANMCDRILFLSGGVISEKNH